MSAEETELYSLLVPLSEAPNVDQQMMAAAEATSPGGSTPVAAAIDEATAETDRPTLICCKTIIGYGSPNLAGSHDCHGAPLGDDEVAATRENIGWTHPPFEVPSEVYEGWNSRDKGAKAEDDWNAAFSAYREAHPDLAAEFERRMAGELPADWDSKAAEFISDVNDKAETIASRKASQNCLNAYGPLLPELLGGGEGRWEEVWRALVRAPEPREISMARGRSPAAA